MWPSVEQVTSPGFLAANPIDRIRSLIQNPSVSTHRFEDKLRLRAEGFIASLKPAGLDGTILENSFREYSVKVAVTRKAAGIGSAVLYYKPKSESFSMSTHELKDKSLAVLLEDCWHNERPSHGCEIYVDGSFASGATGYGAVILKDGKVVEELFGGVDSAEVAGTYQIAGELAAVREGLKWCAAHSVNEVSIYYDYLGIEKWATGEWKAKQPLTQEYARFVRECAIRIRWRKVDSHTGNRWNDRADALARKGAGSIPSTETNLIGELLARSDAWIEFLMLRGIEACLDRVYNEQFARVFIIEEEEAVGTFDLYNTKKKGVSPYLHDFRDDALKLRIENLWSEFSNSVK